VIDHQLMVKQCGLATHTSLDKQNISNRLKGRHEGADHLDNDLEVAKLGFARQLRLDLVWSDQVFADQWQTGRFSAQQLEVRFSDRPLTTLWPESNHCHPEMGKISPQGGIQYQKFSGPGYPPIQCRIKLIYRCVYYYTKSAYFDSSKVRGCP
jgi:hypothetical protein